MAQMDMHNQVYPTIAKNFASIATDTTTTGTNIIDMQGYNSLEFVFASGARTDGTYTPLIRHGDAANLSDAADVDDADLLGTEAAAAISAANTVKRIGYVGNKRYVRFDIVSTGTTSGATVGALAVRGCADVQPTPSN